MPKHDYEKRRFIEMYSIALALGRAMAGHPQYISRDIVNKGTELWDEIEHQYPRPQEKDYND